MAPQKPKITSVTNASLDRNEASVESKTDLFTFKTEYLDKPSSDWRNNKLGLNNNESAWGASLDSSLLNNNVKVHSELKSGKFRAYDTKYIENGYDSGLNRYSSYDSDNKLINFALNGKSSLLNYGVKYQQVGENYAGLIRAKEKSIKKDNEGINYWVDRDIDKLNVKLSYVGAD